MLVSHRKKFIYTKTVKTAGTSVESYFEEYCLPEGSWEFSHNRDEHVCPEGVIGYRGFNPGSSTWRNHMPAKQIKKRIGESIWNEYFKFCVVRNPYDKLISNFHMLERNAVKISMLSKLKIRTSLWLNRNVNPYLLVRGESDIERFRSWLLQGGTVNDRNKYIIDKDICVDYFIEYEKLMDGIQYVCEKLDIPFVPEKLPKLKMDGRPALPIEEYYNPETIEIVKSNYAFEIDRFGYQPPR